jgi:hypothetical protein
MASLREVSEPPLREHLLAQMKVTKAKSLNAKASARSSRLAGPARRATWRHRRRSWRQFTRCVFQAIADGHFSRSWTAFQMNVDAVSG